MSLTNEQLEDRAKLAIAEAVALADEKAEQRINKAVEATTTNVVLHVAMSEKVMVERIDSLKWRMTAALLGGQVAAGLVAAVATQKVQSGHVEAVASALLHLF